jgi:hypothetical protein
MQFVPGLKMDLCWKRPTTPHCIVVYTMRRDTGGEFLDRILGISEKHVRVVLDKDVVVDTGVTRGRFMTMT